jgi:small Trp-rich protein
MAFVIVGIILLLLKWQEIGPVAEWSWLIVLAPWALAFAWWQFADSSGLTRRREMEKMDARKEERRQKNMEALGLNWQKQQRVRVYKDSRKREAERVEAEREAQRKKNKDTVSSGFGGLNKPAGHATDEDTRLE